MPQVFTVSGNFVADVIYVQPNLAELKRLYPGLVDLRVEGKKFVPIDSCKQVSLQRRTVTFKYMYADSYVSMYADSYVSMYADSYVSMYAILKEMERRQVVEREVLRLAIYEEAICFSKKYPEEQTEHAVLALGSMVEIRDSLYALCLSCNNQGPGMRLDWSGGEWSRHDRILVACE